MGAADNFFVKAEQALKKRNYDYAIELWQQGLAIDPDRLEERRKLRATAIRRCQENGTNTMGGGLTKFKFAKSLGKIKKLWAQKKFEEFIVENEKYLAAVPQDPKALMGHAQAFERTNRLDSALQTYREVVDIDPKQIAAWKAMGKIYETQKKIDKAVECWERVKAADPSDNEAGKAIRDLSAAKMMAATEERRKQGGDESFRSLLKDQDESAKLQKKQQIVRTADDAASAIEFKREEVEADPENPRQWRELGDLYLKSRKFDEAEECYNKAGEIDPQDMYVKERLGRLTETRLQSEIEDLKAELRKNPDDAKLTETLKKKKKEFDAFLLEELTRRVAAHPTAYQYKFDLGLLLLKVGKHQEAIAQFQNARKDPKFQVQASYRIGQCFFAMHLYDPAIQQYNEALSRVEAKDSDIGKAIKYDLAMAYVENSDLQEARGLLEGIMVDDINYRDVAQKVAEIRGKMS